MFILKIQVLNHDKNVLEFKMIGERHTLPQLLKTELLANSEVEFVSYKLEHPLDNDSSFILKTKKTDPKKVLIETCKDIIKDLDNFEAAVKSLK